jgi:hypothetical protein
VTLHDTTKLPLWAQKLIVDLERERDLLQANVIQLQADMDMYAPRPYDGDDDRR